MIFIIKDKLLNFDKIKKTGIQDYIQTYTYKKI